MPIISFCIPSYNNSQAAFQIVNDLLSSESEDFEIIFCDDNSQDDTQELLSQINDKRFIYIRNAENLGAHKNWLKTLESGRGKYLYLVMGRDKLHGENITSLVELLRDKNFAFVRDKHNAKRSFKIYSGISAMINFLGFNHPTGLIFNRENFSAIPEREKYFASSDMYPENYIIRDLLLKGTGAEINSGIFRDEVVIDYARKKSAVENDKNIFDAYYSPARRTRQFFELVDMIDALPDIFTQHERNKYFHEKFSELLLAVTKAWRGLCANPDWQAHYNQAVRTVTRREMFRNIIQAVHDTTEHLRENHTYNFSRKLRMNYLAVKRFKRVLTG